MPEIPKWIQSAIWFMWLVLTSRVTLTRPSTSTMACSKCSAWSATDFAFLGVE
jgi:hypothetical protein